MYILIGRVTSFKIQRSKTGHRGGPEIPLGFVGVYKGLLDSKLVEPIRVLEKFKTLKYRIYI